MITFAASSLLIRRDSGGGGGGGGGEGKSMLVISATVNGEYECVSKMPCAMPSRLWLLGTSSLIEEEESRELERRATAIATRCNQ